jgi:hypothetical protein
LTGEVHAITLQLDGKLLVGGDFAGTIWLWLNYLTRLNNDGSRDATFNSGANGSVLAIALQPDGKALIGGDFTSYYGTPRNGIARLVGKSITPNGAYDGWILESSETSGKGGTMNSTASTFYLGDNAKKKQYRAILSFDTSGLPDTAVITRVTLKIKLKATVGTSPFTTHGNLLVDIKKGAFGNNNALQLTDFQAAASRNQVGTIKNTPSSGWYSSNLNSVAFTYINKTGLTQFRLRFAKDDDNDSIADYLKFYSGNAGSTYRPQLIVEYHVP